MRTALQLVVLAVAAAPHAAAAGGLLAHPNGRPPATTGVRFQPDGSEDVLLPVTFGLLISSDSGESFRWVCETAIGYSGIFDPDYAISADGAIYASSRDGLRVSRDGGCTWTTISGAGRALDDQVWVSEVEIGPDGRVWVATAQPGGPNDVYVSLDGAGFASSNLPEPKVWWQSLRTTPMDPSRIYVSGFLPQDGATQAAALLRRSVDGGASWEELPVVDFTFGPQPELFVAGVSPTDPDLVFARAARVVSGIGDTLYRSTDGGAHWQQVTGFLGTISAFHIRPDGKTVIAASVSACPEDITDAGVPINGCVRKSVDGGLTWKRPAQQPRLACIDERSDGVLFGCGANFDPDNFALGRSSDGETWEEVFRLGDTAGPLECGADTEQAVCAAEMWQAVCQLAGACPAQDGAPAAPDGGGGGVVDDRGGCCRVGGAIDASWLAGLLVALLMLRRRAR